MTNVCRSQALTVRLLVLAAWCISCPARAQGEPAPAPPAVSSAPSPSAEPAPASLASAPPASASATPSAAPDHSAGLPLDEAPKFPPLANAGPFQQLLTDLRARAEVVHDLRARLDSAPEVARAVLAPQIFDASTDYRRALIDAANSLASNAFPDASPAARQLALAVVTDRLSEEGRMIRQSLKAQYRESLALIERAGDAKKEERAGLEQARNASIERTPVLLQEYRDNLEARARLKEDVKTDRNTFKRQLVDAAKFTSGLLKNVAEEMSRLRQSFGATPKPEEQAELAALRAYRKRLADLQKKQIQLLDEYGADTVELRQNLVTATGDVSDAILDRDVLSGLFKKWRTEAVDTFSANAASFLLRSITVVLIVLAFVVAARVTRSLVRRALGRTTMSLSHLASEFIVTMSGRIIFLVGLVVGMAQLGLEVAPLLAGLGIAGFVVGFALQDTLSNFASGMMILMYRPFDVGDAIEAGGTVGKVQAMNLVSTSVLTFDNQMLIVPNNKIWGDVIRNLTHQTTRRVDLEFGIGYHDDLDHAERVLNDILNQHPTVLSDPAPVVRVHELADSCVKFVVRPWVKTDDYWETYWAITREVKRRFDAEGISIPFPQRDVHLYQAHAAPVPEHDSDLDLRVRDGHDKAAAL